MRKTDERGTKVKKQDRLGEEDLVFRGRIEIYGGRYSIKTNRGVNVLLITNINKKSR